LVSCLDNFQLISLGQNRNLIVFAIELVAGVFLCIGGILYISRIIILSLALARGGVQGARDKVLRTVLRSIKLIVIVIAIVLIPVGFISPWLPLFLTGAELLILGGGYGVLAYKANIVSMEETTKLQGITETCKIMGRMAYKMAAILVLFALVQFVLGFITHRRRRIDII